MRFCLIGMPPDRGAANGEVAIVVPGIRKVAMLVPLAALPVFLPVLYEAMRKHGEQRCPACSAPLPEGQEVEVDHA